jgi:AcrR family transcriptional regulator
MASHLGLEALSIGALAKALRISKSGLFAHFRSKQNLQVQVLQAATAMFNDHVVMPSMQQPPGEARLRSLVERWLDWADCGCPGGCLFVTAAVELDDRPGPLRDALVQAQRGWLDTLSRAAKDAIDAGQLRAEIDAGQLAFDLQALMLGYHHAARLLADPDAKLRTRRAMERLIAWARA